MRLRSISLVLGICILTVSSGVFSRPDGVSAARIAAISAGGLHTCALTTDGGVKCWGRNHYGQLGNGTFVDSAIPVDVVGLESDVAAVSAGGSHSCALTTAGGLKCWGVNTSGQLGDGTYEHRATPVDVVGLTGGVGAVSAGPLRTCAVTTGGVKCWGNNMYGGLGDGGTQPSAVPVDVVGLEGGAATIATGEFYSCVLLSGGGAKCWGLNNWGQLGGASLEDCNESPDYVTPCSTVPLDVVGLYDAGAVVVGTEHTCALTNSGVVECWGGNLWGQLGDGTIVGRSTPSAVVGLEGVVSEVAVGGAHTCALMSAGGVKCWGNNFVGQLGQETGMDCSNPLVQCSRVPVDIPGLSGIGSISAALLHTCALTAVGGVTCWGDNRYGQLGDSDGDGCTDLQEDGDDPALGGQRDLLEFWDFYDTPTGEALTRDGSVTGLDFFAVLERFNATDIGVGDFNRSSDPLSTPNAATGDTRADYHPAYDRSSPGPGDDPWDTGTPDGSISGRDFFAVLAQFNHSCG